MTGRATLALLSVTQFVVVLDVTIVTVALPSIQTSLGFSQADLPWVVDAYLVAFGGFLLLGGRAADLLGRRRVFLAGLVVFGLASVACGLASTAGGLVAARAVQGFGGALLSPAALSLVAVLFPEGAERNRAMGFWNAAAGAGGAAGVLLGGVIVDGLGWEWIFWVNAPLTLGGAVLGVRLIADTGGVSALWREVDVLGAVLVTAGLSTFIYGLVRIGSGSALVALVLAVVLLGAFVVVESRVPVPLVRFGIFRQSTLSAANAMMMLFVAGVVATNFFVTLYLQRVLGYGPVAAGLSFLPLALGQVVFSRVAVRLLPRLGEVRVLIIGMGCAVLGFAWFAAMSPGGSFAADVLGPAALVSVGGGFGFVVLTVLAVAGVEPGLAGLAGGLITMSQQVGGALGLALLASAAAWWTDRASTHGVAVPAALTDGFRLGFLVAAGILLAGTVLAVRTFRRGRAT